MPDDARGKFRKLEQPTTRDPTPNCKKRLPQVAPKEGDTTSLSEILADSMKKRSFPFPMREKIGLIMWKGSNFLKRALIAISRVCRQRKYGNQMDGEGKKEERKPF